VFVGTKVTGKSLAAFAGMSRRLVKMSFSGLMEAEITEITEIMEIGASRAG
jgi:hypothetical protein